MRRVVSGLAKHCSSEELTVFFELVVMQILFIFFLAFIFIFFGLLNSEAYILMFSMVFACAMKNRHVVLITNVKPGKLRNVMSEGLVKTFNQHVIFFN